MVLGVLCLGSLMAGEEDVSNHPRLKHFIGKQYEVVQPVFLAKVGNILVVTPPGRNQNTPISVQTYIDNPISWWETKEYLDVYGRKTFLDEMHPIIGIIPAQTVLRVKYITCKSGGFLGDYIRVMGVVEDARFNKYDVSFNGVMTNLFGAELYPEPKIEYIREICAP